MISFGYDYHWAEHNNRIDQKKHIQCCEICSNGKTCYLLLQERSVQNDKFSFATYLCYLVYAPFYIAGPIISFNAFASQLEVPQKNYLIRDIAWYGLRWTLSLFLMELMTHFFYYNAFATSGMWKQLSPMDNFIIGYMYIPLGGAQRKMLNVWVVFTFVAIWHDLEWKLISWAWLTCIFFIPEMPVQSAANSFQVQGAFGKSVFCELNAVAGAVTITCLMVANLVGFVIGPSGINWLISGFLQKQGLPTLGGMLFTFYIGTKLMFHISDAKQRGQKK